MAAPLALVAALETVAPISGHCGSDTNYCASGCQSNYGSCGVSTTLSWNSLGCYSDSTSTRALNTSQTVAAHTVEACQSTCGGLGFIYAGLEYGSQCFCGNAILGGSTSIASSNCNVLAPGIPLRSAVVPTR